MGVLGVGDLDHDRPWSHPGPQQQEGGRIALRTAGDQGSSARPARRPSGETSIVAAIRAMTKPARATPIAATAPPIPAPSAEPYAMASIAMPPAAASHTQSPGHSRSR